MAALELSWVHLTSSCSSLPSLTPPIRSWEIGVSQLAYCTPLPFNAVTVNGGRACPPGDTGQCARTVLVVTALGLVPGI